MTGPGYYGYRPHTWGEWHSDSYYLDNLILED